VTYDAFTQASPTFREAWRNRANTGAAFTVSPPRKINPWVLAGVLLCIASAAFVVGVALGLRLLGMVL